MADEEQTPQATGGSKMQPIIVGGVVVVIAAIAALLLFNYWIRPLLADTEEETETAPPETIVGAVPYTFEDGYVSVVMQDPDLPASMLAYRVGFLCANQETYDMVDAYKALFIQMLKDLHSYKRREELNDEYVEEGIRAEALVKANELLKQLKGDSEVDLRVLRVMHEHFCIQDQL